MEMALKQLTRKVVDNMNLELWKKKPQQWLGFLMMKLSRFYFDKYK